MFFDLIGEKVNLFFQNFNSFLAQFFFFDVLFFVEGIQFPLVVFVLFISGIFFTFRMGFVNIRLFRHAMLLLFGKSDQKTIRKQKGEISHFKALTTALSATIGLGNIAGVAIAVSVGGPGAVFWMLVMAFIGMNTKFTECSLALIYREEGSKGRIMGGPMVYLRKGLAELGWKRLGVFLSILFAILCIGGSFGGGVAFQVNQSLNAISISLPFLQDYKWLYGLFMMVLVAIVIIGGIRRIAEVSGKIVPIMFVVYMLMTLFVLIGHYDRIPSVLMLIFSEAFSPSAGYGGFMGILVTGLQRAAFSNEAGLGSAPIAHSAAKVNHPIEEGSVALLGPFFDTFIVCTATAFLILVTGVYEMPEYAHLVSEQKGAALTSQALWSSNRFFPYILSVSVFLFAFSTIISWSYYGERCFSFLLGEKKAIVYKFLVLLMIFMGSVATSVDIMNFCDLMILSMSLPNLVGVFLLSGKVKNSLKDYMSSFLKKNKL